MSKRKAGIIASGSVSSTKTAASTNTRSSSATITGSAKESPTSSAIATTPPISSSVSATVSSTPPTSATKSSANSASLSLSTTRTNSKRESSSNTQSWSSSIPPYTPSAAYTPTILPAIEGGESGVAPQVIGGAVGGTVLLIAAGLAWMYRGTIGRFFGGRNQVQNTPTAQPIVAFEQANEVDNDANLDHVGVAVEMTNQNLSQNSVAQDGDGIDAGIEDILPGTVPETEHLSTTPDHEPVIMVNEGIFADIEEKANSETEVEEVRPPSPITNPQSFSAVAEEKSHELQSNL